MIRHFPQQCVMIRHIAVVFGLEMGRLPYAPKRRKIPLNAQKWPDTRPTAKHRHISPFTALYRHSSPRFATSSRSTYPKIPT
jgi:hypothetical protein